MLNSLPGGGAQPSKKIIDLVPGPHPSTRGGVPRVLPKGASCGLAQPRNFSR